MKDSHDTFFIILTILLLAIAALYEQEQVGRIQLDAAKRLAEVNESWKKALDDCAGSKNAWKEHPRT